MAFPVSEDKIISAETALGRRLPERLRKRLEIQNGGDVATEEDDWTLHPVRDASDRKRLSRTANDMVTETRTQRQWRGFPPTAIAIASNGCGDVLIIRPDSDDIFLWDHETGATTPVLVEWE